MVEAFFNDTRVKGYFTNKKSGVSQPPYEGLNLAYHVGDNENDVLKNHMLLRKTLYFKPVAYMEQVHGDVVKVANKSGQYEACDALITDKKELPLMVMVADCIPILFYDRGKEVIGVAHAGRNGSFLNIAVKTLDKMTEVYGCSVGDIVVHLGASIRACCYEVSDELAMVAKRSFGEQYVVNKRFLDLQRLNSDMLRKHGVKKILDEPLCTCCEKDFYSY